MAISSITRWCRMDTHVEKHHMKNRIMFWSLSLLIGWAIPTGAQEPQVDPLQGEGVYQDHCVRCHGIQGKGDGPDAAALVVPPANFQRMESRAKSETDLRSAIIWGLAFSPMHGWWDKLSVEEIRAVTAYIRQIAPYEPSVP
ncbi:MAG: cytochrome c [Nitrospirales bacterium]|nr:cytochrome c [Nitrospirales bacterium]